MFGWFKKNPKFKIGDLVRCIDDRDHIIQYGKTYKILDVNFQDCCNTYSYDVGLTCSDFTKCTCKKNSVIPGKGIRWAGEFRFAPHTPTKEEIEQAMTDALKEENYELASELRDKLKIS